MDEKSTQKVCFKTVLVVLMIIQRFRCFALHAFLRSIRCSIPDGRHGARRERLLHLRKLRIQPHASLWELCLRSYACHGRACSAAVRLQSLWTHRIPALLQ